MRRRSPRSRSGRGLRYAFAALLLVGSGCSGGGNAAPTGPPPGQADPLRDAAQDQGSVHVIVDLAVEQLPDGTWDGEAIAAAQDELLAGLGKGVQVTARYETTPQLALELDRRSLRKLRASRLVLGIHLNETDEATE